MRVYIATSLSNVDTQRELALALGAMGIEQTFDWTRNGTMSGRPYNEVAQDEMSGIAEADFVVVLLPGGKGTHAEMGAAIMSGKTVFINAAKEDDLLGNDKYMCVFYSHPSVTLVVGALNKLVESIKCTVVAEEGAEGHQGDVFTPWTPTNG